MKINLDSVLNSMPFPGRCLDGVTGFNVRVDTSQFEPHEVAITIHKSIHPTTNSIVADEKCSPTKYNVLVRAERSKLKPNISCSAFKQQAVWDFALPIDIDPKSLECSYDADGFLIMQANWNTTNSAEEMKQDSKKRRLEVNDQFNDVNVKKRLRLEEEMEIDLTLSQIKQVNSDLKLNWGSIPFDILHLILRRLPKAKDIRNCALVNKNWQIVSRSIKLPAKLIINSQFLESSNVNEFLNVFQNVSPLPFSNLVYACHDLVGKPPQYLINFLIENESSFKFIDVTCNFRSYGKFQQCELLNWIKNFQSANYLKLRIYGFKHQLPIAFGDFQMHNVKVLDISEKHYIEMREELRKRMKNIKNIISRM